MRFVLVALSGLVVGLVIAWWLSGPRHDWRAAELTGWCNHYRASAIAKRARIVELVRALGPPRDGDRKWRFLYASEAENELMHKIGSIQRMMRGETNWYLRCAAAPIPKEVPLGDEDPYDLVRYLDEVIASLPRRAPHDPRAYVQPIERPEGFLFVP